MLKISKLQEECVRNDGSVEKAKHNWQKQFLTNVNYMNIYKIFSYSKPLKTFYSTCWQVLIRESQGSSNYLTMIDINNRFKYHFHTFHQPVRYEKKNISKLNKTISIFFCSRLLSCIRFLTYKKKSEIYKRKCFEIKNKRSAYNFIFYEGFRLFLTKVNIKSVNDHV